jgi:hypothetical protein
MESPILCHSHDNSSPVYYYRVFGLTIESPLVCPELLPAEGTPDVTIRYGAVPDSLESVQHQGGWYQGNCREFLLKIDDIANYLVIGGEQIIIERAPGVQDNEVRLFLLGSAFGALLQQRGLLPLHGCAVEVNGATAIFVGPSGYGKSTLAETLRQRGYRVMADDVSVISFLPAGVPLVLSAYPQLKLWADSLKVLGKNSEGLPRVEVGEEKYGLPLREGFSNHSLPLKWVYELDVSNSQDFELTTLKGIDKLSVLIGHTYRLEFLAGTLGKKRHFEQCGQAARHCQVSRLVRPMHPFRLEDLVDLLEKDWA